MQQSYRPQPSLDNAYARIRRAEEHITRLESEIAGTIKGITPPGVTVYGKMPPIFIQLPLSTVPYLSYPPTISILIGECVYNLRAALDYLIYELAILDSGNVQDGTQFPIEDSKKGWIDHKGWLKGVSMPHKTNIERLQPYNGCNWARDLRSISNPDKHRRFTYTPVKFVVPGIDQAHPPDPNLPMEVDSQITIHITFDDGTDIIEKLKILKSEITAVLDSFKSDFPTR